MRKVVQAFAVLVAGVAIGVLIAPATVRHKCVVRSHNPVNPQVTMDCDQAGEKCTYTYTYER